MADEQEEYGDEEYEEEEDDAVEDPNAPGQSQNQMIGSQENNQKRLSHSKAEDKKSKNSRFSKSREFDKNSQNSKISHGSNYSKASNVLLPQNKKNVSVTNNNVNLNKNGNYNSSNKNNFSKVSGGNNEYVIPSPQNVVTTRAYLEETVTSVIKDALLELARTRPENPLEFVGNYILKRAHEK